MRYRRPQTRSRGSAQRARRCGRRRSLCPRGEPAGFEHLGLSRVPAPGEFSWRPVACDVNAELTVRVHDAYPGPLPITGTLTTPHGQPVVYDLRPGNSDIVAPATAISLTLFVQVRGGEGAVTILTMQHAQWAGLCPAASHANATPPAAAPPGLPSTGHPPMLSRRG
jgi:hypothetical protein